MMLLQGAGSSAALQDDWCALHYAACFGRLAVTVALLDHGADVDAVEQVRTSSKL